MELMVLTPENNVVDEAVTVNRLFDAGLERLHVRKPGCTRQRLRQYIEDIAPAYHSLIVLHNHFELADDMGLGGIHLNSYMRADAAVWDQISKLSPASVSTSFHSWDEIAANEYLYSYVFISPVFDSISKKGYEAAIDLKGAADLKQQMAMQGKYCPRITGLGGVGPAEVATLRSYSFDGAAMLGAIWMTEDRVGVFEQAMNSAKE